MRTIKFLIVYLFLTTNLLSAEIEILVDKPGEGKKIINHSWVQIEYTGSFIDGKVFDTNVGKDRPLVVQIGMREVIPGFEMGIVGTNKGTIRKIKIPSELAYGSSGAGDVIPPNSDLIFEFKIIDVLDPNYNLISSDELKNNLDVYKENRKLMIKGLKDSGFSKISSPDGAFYIYADVSKFCNDSLEFANRVLKEAKVAITPGLDFDTNRGNSTIRFSYARSTEDIIKGLEKLNIFMKNNKYI